MNNVDKFLERLKTFKPLIDDGKIPKKSFDATRSYLELPHFNRYTFALLQLAWSTHTLCHQDNSTETIFSTSWARSQPYSIADSYSAAAQA